MKHITAELANGFNTKAFMLADWAAERYPELTVAKKAWSVPTRETVKEIISENIRFAAVVFVDLEGFSSICNSRGLHETIQALLTAERLVITASAEHRAMGIKPIGDSWMLHFDHIREAIGFTRRLYEMIRELNRSEELSVEISPCAGIAYGEVVSIEGFEIYGDAVNTAAFCGEDSARGWEVLMTGVVHAELGERATVHGSAANGEIIYSWIPAQTKELRRQPLAHGGSEREVDAA